VLRRRSFSIVFEIYTQLCELTYSSGVHKIKIGPIDLLFLNLNKIKKSLSTLLYMVVSCKEATNKKIETEVSKQADSLTAQVQQVAEL
jgi:hypothetical protein